MTTAMHLALECAIDLSAHGIKRFAALVSVDVFVIGDERAEELFGRFLDESRLLQARDGEGFAQFSSEDHRDLV